MLKVDVLIVGAGPTGMAAALALSKAGKHILIIDKHEKGIGFSRALLVNTYTLKALESYGVTAKIINRSWPVRGVSVFGNKGQLLEADFTKLLKRESINPVILAQLETEQCMNEALQEKGVQIKRPYQLIHFTQDPEGVTASIQHSQNTNDTLTVRADFMIGSDGFRSETRKLLGIEYIT